MRTANPTLRADTFSSSSVDAMYGGVAERDTSATMTIEGTVHRTFMLLGMVLLTAAWTWHVFSSSGNVPASVMPHMVIGLIGGFIFALITVFKQSAAPFTAPCYALLEGLAIGGISAMFEARYPGIVIKAVGLTFGTLFCLLVAYRTGIIRATEKFKLGVLAATGAVFMLYIVTFMLNIFGVTTAYMHGSGTLSIVISGVIVVIAALNLVLDFDLIEKGAEAGAPKYMEWYAAFGLMVTLIWLYLEILRLLSKINRR